MAGETPDAGRVVLVTGGAAGIGRAIVERLAADGWRVVFADRDADAGRSVATAVAERGGVCRFEHLDLTDRPARRGLVAAVTGAFGRIDALVNNAAAVGARTGILDLTEDDWDAVIETNLTAAAFLARDAARSMVETGSGAIVNVGTIQERLPLTTHTPYVSSKGGVSALTRALAIELSPRGIRVNAVVPGVIETLGMALERDRLGIRDQPPDDASPALLPRFGRPQDVAGAVAYLLSDDAGFVTGSTVTVDGGRSLSRKPDSFAAGMDALEPNDGED